MVALWLNSWPMRQRRSFVILMNVGLTKQIVKRELCTSTESLCKSINGSVFFEWMRSEKRYFADQAKTLLSTPTALPKPTRLTTPNMIESRVVCVIWVLIEDSKSTNEWANYSTLQSRAIYWAKTHVSNDRIWALIYIYIWTIIPLWWVTHTPPSKLVELKREVR